VADYLEIEADELDLLRRQPQLLRRILKEARERERKATAGEDFDGDDDPAYRYVGSAQEAGPCAVADRDQSGLMVWRRDVRWSAVDEASGRVGHPAMEWASIIGAYRYLRSDSQQPGIWDRGRGERVLPLRQLARLANDHVRHRHHQPGTGRLYARILPACTRSDSALRVSSRPVVGSVTCSW
jgi:hypothetical protein